MMEADGTEARAADDVPTSRYSHVIYHYRHLSIIIIIVLYPSSSSSSLTTPYHYRSPQARSTFIEEMTIR